MQGQIAVLVDGDQLGPDGMPALLEKLGKNWTVTERICVRNWRSTRDQQAWREFSADHAFRLIQRDPVAAGKNASDIELAVIAMDLLAAGHRAFCLVSGDMDFTPLVDRLRRGGCHVEWVRPADMPRPTGSPRARGRARAASSRAQPASAAQPRPAAAPAARSTAPASRTQPVAKAGAAGSASGRSAKSSKATSAAARPAAADPVTPRPGAAKPGAAKPGPAKPGMVDLGGFSRAVRRVIAELRRAGEHERGWVSVNRLGSKLTEAGTTKDDFGFPKRRPLWAALQEAGFEIEQMETGQYRVTMGAN